jgi:U3 small nucleolar RNA-associated protein 14
MLKKDKLKAPSADMELDPEAAKDYAEKQERMRTEARFCSFFLDKYVSPITLFTQNCSQERMTLKHKNTSRWTRRIKKRGLSVQDEGTRAAIAAQLQQHALLIRKMNSMNDGSSRSDES